jgi:flagellar biosynthesis/type III secretory pathway ATPase
MLELLAAYEENRELISIGAYARGSNAMADTAIELESAMTAFLRQGSDEHMSMPETCKQLLELAAMSERIRQVVAAAPKPVPVPTPATLA